MTPSREAALERLGLFLPRAGTDYARNRNFDHGPAERGNVSMLSPYLRHRLITEEEVTQAVLAKHGAKRAEKFLQEIAWRTYWKGWLEMRPAVWDDYLQALSTLPRDAPFEQATSANTGIECFDDWARELVEFGYLHNHTRMWFASIWIFTLRLPWQLGAEFFMRHLIDADPASNTLSWRWVAGLQTPGKHYLARASNIARYTSGRYNPVGELNEGASPLPHDRKFPLQALNLDPDPPTSGIRVGHLLTADDLAPAPPTLGPMASHAVISNLPDPSGQVARRFLEGAIDDTAERLEARKLDGDLDQAIETWVGDEQLDLIVCSRPTVGPFRESLPEAEAPIRFFTRSWDRTLWPKATAGFFKLRKSLPRLHRDLSGILEFDFGD